jgi:hypothetical protein
VQLTRPTLTANRTGIAVEGADLVLKGPGELTHHRGPAILVEKNGSLSAEELTFEENQRDYSTGQIHLVGAFKVSLQKITVQNSEAIGLYAKDCPDIRMTNSTFTSNLHGGIVLVNSRLIASEVKMLRNGEKEDNAIGLMGGWGVAVTLASQIAGYKNSTLEVRDAVLDGYFTSRRGLYMEEGHVAIKKCQIHSHYYNGVYVKGGSECTIEDSQLEKNGLGSSEFFGTYFQLFIREVEKVALSDLRVIGGKGGGVCLDSCKNASLSGKSIIRGNQETGLKVWRTQLTVEQAEFQDNGKANTPEDRYYYYFQILADEASNVQLKEVQIYEGRHSGGVWVRKQSTVKLEGGSIHGHGREAIRVGSKIVVIGARIFGNAQEWEAQVIVGYECTAEMEDACIQDSPHGGVFVGDGGTLILKRCQVHNNKAYNLRREGTGHVEFIDMPPVED